MHELNFSTHSPKFLTLNGLAPNGGVNYPPTRKIENFQGKNIPYDKTLRLFEQNLVF